MKTIPLNKGSIDLPSKWEDLTFSQKIIAFEKLKQVIEFKLDPKVFRIEILQLITGYKPQSGAFKYLFRQLLYIVVVPWVSLFFRIRYGKIRYSAYWSVWKHYHKPKRNDREIINFNLYRLSEQLDFAFELRKCDNKPETILIKKEFERNPIPYLKIQGRKYTGRKFVRDIAPFTNITPKEFSDCFDLYIAYNQVENPPSKEKYLNKLISILYPLTSNHNDNLVSDHVEMIATISPGLKLGIYLWFSGIVDFYYLHPVYSILFRSNKTQDDGKISLGMNSTMLMAEKKGYDLKYKDLNDYFDIQIQVLKDDLSYAIAHGTKVEELSDKTGLSITDINRII